jgi:hypothetical protein
MKPIALYLLHLNPEARGLTDRYSVMRMTDDGSLSPLWGRHIEADPGDSTAWNRAGRKSANAWPYMTFKMRPDSGPDRYPAFHFVINGYGFNKVDELARSIAETLGWPVALFPVTGWNSSPTRAAPRKCGTRKAALARLARRD